MANGTVKWFNATKGFGFIQPTDGGTDVFLDISAVERAGMSDLNEGQKISYDVVADRRTGKSSADNLKPWGRGLLTLSRLRLTGAARNSAKAQKRLATTSLSPSLPQLRLCREIISKSGFFRRPNDCLQLCVKDFVPVAALDGRPKPRERDAESSRE